MYVTLEPCSKPGLVGACTDAIIAAGISRVVYAIPDPNPKNRGKAKRALAKAGVKCERLMDSEVGYVASSLVAPFAKHVATGLPYVTVKIAMSLDGKICDDSGAARWISSAPARCFTGGLRERVDAIMVGGETIRRDNPSLLSHGKANPDLVRVVVSKSGKLMAATVLTPDCGRVRVVTVNGTEEIVYGRRSYVPQRSKAGSIRKSGPGSDWLMKGSQTSL